MQRPPVSLIALDLDGTLLTSRKTITTRTHKALAAAASRGIHIVFATARPPRSVRAYYHALGIRTPQINYNGALIWDESSRQTLAHTPLAAAHARRAIAFARDAFPELCCSVEVMDKLYTDRVTSNQAWWTETEKLQGPDYVGPLADILANPITKLMFVGDPAWIADLETTISAHFGAVLGHTRSDPHLLALMAPGISKGTALARIARQLEVPPEAVLAIGDAPNDADMLTFAGTAVVPENAWPAVKPLADMVVPSNDEDGVAIALERLVL